MTALSRFRGWTMGTAAALVLFAAPAAAHQADSLAVRVDSVFARFASRESPGCAVAVARGGRPVLERAYGMADLEHAVPNTTGSVFEAGSVSKQFTAAAILLLAQQGKLSLDDDVRKHIPELPDYGRPITLRHMLNHTSGFRDWGAIASLEGWPRGSRVHTHTHVLDIVRRQRSLNYPPGSQYLYSNTNYNLSAIIVDRLSGMPFAEFTRRHLFEPLGMTSTQWRDDYTRIVAGRAVAYDRSDDAYRLDMPFENVHGNGGLLTTVGDLLKWNASFDSPQVGRSGLIDELQRRGRLTNGREISYAAGLVIGTYRGIPEVAHSGATAGYRAFLARYPAQQVSLALLCNAGDADATRLGHEVADALLGDVPRPEIATPAAVPLPPEALASRAGTYRSTRTQEPARLVVRDGKLRVVDGPELVPLSRTEFQVPGSTYRVIFRDGPDGRAVSALQLRPDGDTIVIERVEAVRPTAAQLGEYAGEYSSNEVPATYTVVVDGGKLMMRNRLGDSVELEPAYRDGFTSRIGVATFERDPRGRITALRLWLGRVRGIRFTLRR